MDYDLTFEEACKALEEKKCTIIEKSETCTQYAVDVLGILGPASRPTDGIKRTPAEFLGKWRMVDKKPVQREEVIENVTWHKNPDACIVYPIAHDGVFPWTDLIDKPEMQVVLRWKE